MRMIDNRLWALLIYGAALFSGGVAVGFENTKVMPKGVRNVDVREVSTYITQKADAAGRLVGIGQPLEQDLTFQKVINNEKSIVKKKELQAFMLTESPEITVGDTLGTYTADLEANVNVTAPIIAYGYTAKTTLAVAIPVYAASTATKIGFHPNNAVSSRFFKLLNDPNVNQPASAIEAADKLNDARGQLQQKLSDNGYAQLGTWQNTGLGDITLAAKNRFFSREHLAAAATGGIVLPTGQTADPDNLTSLPFGNGTTDYFAGVIVDEPIVGDIFFNQYVKYTYQSANRKTIRMQTEDEQIEVEKKSVDFKLGDKVDTGFSIQYEPQYGLLCGLGFDYQRKFADRYDAPIEVRRYVEKETDQMIEYGSVMLGYSTVPAFTRGEFKVPASVSMEYRKPLRGRWAPMADMTQVDINLFF